MAFKVQIVNTEENANNMILVSGLTIEIVKLKYNWLLNATVKNCIVGEDDYGLVWYSGEWVCGEWVDGTWYSGIWDDGTWKNGKWYSYLIDKAKIVAGIFVILDKYYTYSQFLSGYWKGGDFYDGIFGADRDISSGITYSDLINKDFTCSYWENGKFHNGIFKNSVWVNGIFYNGNMSGSYWMNGTFYNGTFNHHQWFNGLWYGGDFQEGDWFNGTFDQIDVNIKSRFGTANLYNSKTSWYGGTFYNGEFHSGLNLDSSGNTMPSINSSLTHWYNGNFRGGKWYGGHFHNGNFYIGNWYGGVFNDSFGLIPSSKCIWHDGNWYNGLWMNGTFLDGHFYDGMWLDGIFSGGYISTNIIEGVLLTQSLASNPNLPTVVTSGATNITSNNATLNGRVTNNGGATILDRGICWSINSDPVTGNTINNSYLNDGGSMGNISMSIGGLTSGTLYYFRAYARNITGITYGNQMTFNTIVVPNSPPSVHTLGALNISSGIIDGTGTADGKGNITDSTSSPVTSCGIYYDTTPDPYPLGSIATGVVPGGPNGIGEFTAQLTNLYQLTTYNIRAFAINADGIGIGEIYPFTTPVVSPVTACVVTTYDPIQSIADTSAVTYAEVLDNGNGTISTVGACWSTTINPTTSDPHTIDPGVTGPFYTTMTGLSPSTTYHVRAYAINSFGTSYGEDRVFTTTQLRTVPTVIMIKSTPI
jgi:hypothetical protein